MNTTYPIQKTYAIQTSQVKISAVRSLLNKIIAALAAATRPTNDLAATRYMLNKTGGAID
jgi:hypothetical protein